MVTTRRGMGGGCKRGGVWGIRTGYGELPNFNIGYRKKRYRVDIKLDVKLDIKPSLTSSLTSSSTSSRWTDGLDIKLDIKLTSSPVSTGLTSSLMSTLMSSGRVPASRARISANRTNAAPPGPRRCHFLPLQVRPRPHNFALILAASV